MSNYIVSTSPHFQSTSSTKTIMLDVIIALIPATIAMIVLYGIYPLFLMVLCVGSAVFGEWIYNVITKKPQSVGDLSAIVTGMILALNLPPVVPFYVPIVGGLFSIIIVKMLFGGIGKNFANPAITGRIFLMLCWTGIMTSFVIPNGFVEGTKSFFQQAVNINLGAVDGLTSATPLASVKASVESGAAPLAGYVMASGWSTGNAYLDMFLGIIGGSAGEICSLAILVGGLYLVIRRVIDWKIPVIYIASTVIFTALFFCKSEYCGEYVYTYLFGGGLLFGAFFMATDYATSPKSTIAVVIYALLLGLLTVVFRKYSTMNEGVSFAILLMNIATPLLEKIAPKAFGTPKKTFKKIFEKKAKPEAEGGKNG